MLATFLQITSLLIKLLTKNTTTDYYTGMCDSNSV